MPGNGPFRSLKGWPWSILRLSQIASGLFLERPEGDASARARRTFHSTIWHQKCQMSWASQFSSVESLSKYLKRGNEGGKGEPELGEPHDENYFIHLMKGIAASSRRGRPR